MKKIFLILFFLVALSGYAVSEEDTSQQIDERFQKANEWLKKENLSVTKSAADAFMNDYVMVVAEGFPSATAKIPAQKRITAERAATAIAYRQLAEFLEGVAVVGDTLVKDAELQYDIVRTAVTGFVKGAQVVYKEYNDKEGSALVIVKVGMTGPESFAKVMYDKIIGDAKIKKEVVGDKPTYKPTPVALEEKYDGLIVDATEQNFRPALINRIFSPTGEVIYDPAKISQKVLVEQGCGDYTNSVDKAKAALEARGVKNPLIVKATATVTPSDIQVSEEDAVKIYSANQKSGFLSGAKVAFVLK